MAKVTLIKTDFGNLLNLKGSVPKDIVKAVSDDVVEVVRKRMHPIVQAHYDNVITEVGRKLNGLGMPLKVEPPVKSGLAKASRSTYTLNYGKANGGIGRFKTGPWAALKYKYANHQPVSLWFWQKRGLDDWEASLSKDYAREIKGKGVVDVRAANKASRNHHKGRINVNMLIGFSPLYGPFESLITQPFATLLPGSPDSGGAYGDRLGVSRAYYAEKNRPFIKRLSATLGKEMRIDLAKKLLKL
jgi:hypothetical protein